MSYDIEYTDEFNEWWQTLTEDQQDDFLACIEQLEEYGPKLGRPIVDRIKGSKYKNLKEIRCESEDESGHETNLRVLFIFDPLTDSNSSCRRKQNRPMEEMV